jgi:hypothetical protein
LALEHFGGGMSWGFLFGVFVVVAIIVGVSVLVGKMLSRPGGSDDAGHRQRDITALKASGALRHRKSNRP